MFSDVVCYTAIMGRDERQALRVLDGHRELLRTILPKYNGRIAGEIGDGTLSSFHSAIDAVNCAREVQVALHAEPDLKARIGIHLGDVVFSNNTVLGDGVNIASRIHTLASPGTICISEHVYDAIRNKPGITARHLGQKRLKNDSRPIGVYILSAGGDSADAGYASFFSSDVVRPLRGGKRLVLAAGLGAFLTWRSAAASRDGGRPCQVRPRSLLPSHGSSVR
jgi:adenylate cyclase